MICDTITNRLAFFMILSKEDAKLFFELWLPLLDFVNTEYQVCTD